jgi:hypothetical protein
MSELPLAAKVFIVLTVLAGVSVLAYGTAHLRPAAPLQLAVFLAAAVAASRLKVSLPGVNGTLSVNLPFFLIVAALLSIPEALLVAFLSSLAQSVGRSGRTKPVQLVFNAALLINAVGLAAATSAVFLRGRSAPALAIIAGAGAYFLANTVPVTVVLWLAEGERPLPTWRRIADLTFPYYLLSACLAAIVCSGLKNPLWTLALSLFAVMYLTHRSYRVYFSRPVSDSKRVEDNSGQGAHKPNFMQPAQAHH